MADPRVIAAKALPPSVSRPSFLIILADDLGLSDVGAFGGGDIETPHLNELARAGLRFSHFYATPVCSPSRAALLSGMDAHKAGLGNMAEDLAPNQAGQDSYAGYLSPKVVSLAELLKDAGYATLMAGKWHLGLEESQGPQARGFQHSFALLQGGGSHFDLSGTTTDSPVSKYRDDGRLIDTLPHGFYSSDYYASRMIGYLDRVPRSTPFFAYLAFTAPHWPLQAPTDLIKKYADRYTAGPTTLRTARLAGLVREGLLPRDALAHDSNPSTLNWSALSPEQRAIEARKMAVYAAMVDRLDWNVGRVLAALKRQGRLDNTYIVFLSDNGAEGHDLGVYPEFANFAARFDNRLDNIGHVGSFIWYGRYWAQAASAPGRLYKGFPSEGGIHVPAFVWGPGGSVRSGVSDTLVSIMDVAPTLLELARVPQNEGSYLGHFVHRMEGRSLLPLLRGQASEIRSDSDFLGWEVFGRSAILQRPWKLERLERPVDGGVWELFDLSSDPFEQVDLAKSHPSDLQRLQSDWDRYSQNNHVIIPNEISGY